MNYIRIEEVGGKTLERANKLLAGIPDGAYKAAHAALQRAGNTAKTKAGQFAAAEYTINKSTFMSHVNIKTNLTGSAGSVVSMRISYAGSVLPLLTFNTRFSRSGLVQTQVKRNGGASSLQHTFVANIFGNTAVFERLGVKRFPVEQKYGPSTGHMMQNEKVVEEMDKTISETFDKRMEQEIYRLLNGFGG